MAQGGPEPDPRRPHPRAVPAERNCGSCEPNAEGLCRFAAARYEGPHHHQTFLASRRFFILGPLFPSTPAHSGRLARENRHHRLVPGILLYADRGEEP